jgi:hypothetical protein
MSTKKAAQARKMMGLAKQRELFEWLYKNKAHEVRHRKGHTGGPVHGVERGQVPTHLQGAVEKLVALGVLEKSYRQFRYRQMGKFQPQKVCDLKLILSSPLDAALIHRITVGGKHIITTGDAGLEMFDEAVMARANALTPGRPTLPSTRRLQDALAQADGTNALTVLLHHGPAGESSGAPIVVRLAPTGPLLWESPTCTPHTQRYIAGIDPIDNEDGNGPKVHILEQRVLDDGQTVTRMLDRAGVTGINEHQPAGPSPAYDRGRGVNNFRYPDEATRQYEAEQRRKSGLDY